MFLPNEEKTYLFLPTDSRVCEPIVGYPLDSLEVVDDDESGMTKLAMLPTFIVVGQKSVTRVLSPLTDMTMSLSVPIRVVTIMVIA